MSWSPCPDPVLGDARSCDAIETVIVPRAVDLGEMTVRRALPSLARQMVGPFIFFDQMGPAEFLTDQGIDVRPHPHVNLATVTYLLEGQILHRDSLGTEQAIEPGAVNWMQAGKGIVHSERTAPARRRSGQRLFGLQTWMALPAAVEESDPAFVHLGAEALPVITDGALSLRLVAGELHGHRAPLATASETLYADVTLAAGGRYQIEATHEERAIYIVEGALRVDGTHHEAGTLLIAARGAPIDVSAAREARFMLFGGEPMEGPRYIWWNFVSSRPERIAQAKEEWRRGRFETVPGDEVDFIPLPEDTTKPRRAVGGRAFD
ncbi:pirin family protein [Rhodosalinus sp. K401]|uniref:pirin family protein n=1 Tax=Rhodosalinus sp. K401 TaxID=3239195 RepID=UPI003523EB91